MAVKDAADKQARALGLHLQGASYQQIADVLGYANRMSAHKAVTAALKNRVPPVETVEAYQVEAARLEMVLTALSPAVRAGDTKATPLFMAAAARRTELARFMAEPAAAAEATRPPEVRTPLDELVARRATRGNRGVVRGAKPAAAGVPEVVAD